MSAHPGKTNLVSMEYLRLVLRYVPTVRMRFLRLLRVHAVWVCVCVRADTYICILSGQNMLLPDYEYQYGDGNCYVVCAEQAEHVFRDV